MPAIYESEIEKMAIEELIDLEYEYIPGMELTPEGAPNEREKFSNVILSDRLITAIRLLNKDMPEEAVIEAYKKVVNVSSNNDVTDNETFHSYITDGVPVEYRKNGEIVGDIAYIISPDDVLLNDFLVVNQLTIVENGYNKRPDIIIYINGLPIVLFELKNAVDESATIYKAYQQINTYKNTIKSLFLYNEICVISDGFEAKIGSFTAPYSRFNTWKIKKDLNAAPHCEDELTTAISGLFNKDTLIDYILNFVAFEKAKIENEEGKVTRIDTVKKIAAYHQYYAVNKAVNHTIDASNTGGTRKAGVVWHTQGSGKSLSMVFYAGKIVKALNNPTIVVITDRNDLDDQLFDTFAMNNRILRQPPKQAETRSELKELLSVQSGGVVFTTIQKFSPDDGSSSFDMLSARRNIIVIADEAHRTQYGFEAKIKNAKDKNNQIVGQKITYGFAKYLRDALPNATYIGFTGTPVEKKDWKCQEKCSRKTPKIMDA